MVCVGPISHFPGSRYEQFLLLQVMGFDVLDDPPAPVAVSVTV